VPADNAQPVVPDTQPTVVIAGYGLPGRAVAEECLARAVPFCIIERNASVVMRCIKSNVCILEGDCCDTAVLLRAGLAGAAVYVIAIADDTVIPKAVQLARQINPKLRVIARCTYMSTGIAAERLGADEVVVAEQLVAQQCQRAVTTALGGELPQVGRY